MEILDFQIKYTGLETTIIALENPDHFNAITEYLIQYRIIAVYTSIRNTGVLFVPHGVSPEVAAIPEIDDMRTSQAIPTSKDVHRDPTDARQRGPEHGPDLYDPCFLAFSQAQASIDMQMFCCGPTLAFDPDGVVSRAIKMVDLSVFDALCKRIGIGDLDHPDFLIIAGKGIDHALVGHFTLTIFRRGQNVVAHLDLFDGLQAFPGMRQRAGNETARIALIDD